tara:strand:+ start:994 stop:2058 length:1065 start_codon:yes stop_codon:yes gene_type:complete
MPSILRQYRTHDDILGVWHIPNQKVLWSNSGLEKNGSWYYIKTNSTGIRDEREFSTIKKEGFHRILLFGDSYTFGSGIDVKYRYSNRLEAKIKNLEIINFGIGSSGIDQQYLIYKHFGFDYKADILMINPYLNNIARATAPYSFSQDRNGKILIVPKPYFIIENNQLTLKNNPVPKPSYMKDKHSIERNKNQFGQHLLGVNPNRKVNMLVKKYFLQTNYKYWFIKLFPIQPYPEYSSHNHPYWILGKMILEKFIAASRQKIVIITPLPSWSVIMNPKLGLYMDRFYELHNPDKKIIVINILPYFLKLTFNERTKCFNSKYDHHYSELGNKVVAEGLFTELNKFKIINKSSEVII